MKKSIVKLSCLAIAAIGLAGCPPAPELGVSTTTLRFGVNPATNAFVTTQSFEVSNTGSRDTTLVFAVTADQPWIDLDVPATTSTGTDDPVTITVTIDRDFVAKSNHLSFASGNITVSAGSKSKTIKLTTAPDLFTEQITNGGDLAGLALNFTPSGGPSFYTQTNSPIGGFPTAPAGFELDFGIFGDPIEAGLLGGRKVSFYGVEYDTLWIASDGSVSFGDDPGPSGNSLGDHFEVPRISALPVDASGPGSLVTYGQDATKLFITYEDADTKGVSGSGNDFQIELFFNGDIRLSYVDVDPTLSGVVGLSLGGFQGSVPTDFVPSDLSAANTAPLKAAL